MTMSSQDNGSDPLTRDYNSDPLTRDYDVSQVSSSFGNHDDPFCMDSFADTRHTQPSVPRKHKSLVELLWFQPLYEKLPSSICQL